MISTLGNMLGRKIYENVTHSVLYANKAGAGILAQHKHREKQLVYSCLMRSTESFNCGADNTFYRHSAAASSSKVAGQAVGRLQEVITGI